MLSPTSAATGDSSEQSGLNLSALGSPGRRRSVSGYCKSNVEHCCKLLVLGLLHRYFLFLCFQPTQAAGVFRGFGFEKWLPTWKQFCPLFILTVVLWKWHQLLCYFMLSLGQSRAWTINSCSTQIAKHSARGSALHCQALQRGAGHPWVGGNHLNQLSTGWSPNELPPASQKQGKRRAQPGAPTPRELFPSSVSPWPGSVLLLSWGWILPPARPSCHQLPPTTAPRLTHLKGLCTHGQGTYFPVSLFLLLPLESFAKGLPKQGAKDANNKWSCTGEDLVTQQLRPSCRREKLPVLRMKWKVHPCV